MIASFFDGRVRLRNRALKEPETMQMVQDVVSKQDGILEMSANLKTGSLLITYDPAKITRESLLEAAGFLQDQLAEKSKDLISKKRMQLGLGPVANCYRGMGRKREMTLLSGLYSATVMGGFLNKRVHVASGVLFTLLTLMHVYTRRNRLG
ncbi:heavy-metal-associated domain-containing protein [Desulfovibrio sp. OttesenSCG-928-G15]|nr:heavy-metal-associated domain-containing protein [Desulfovibrio sp. OttesenSCG-928-G15]